MISPITNIKHTNTQLSTYQPFLNNHIHQGSPASGLWTSTGPWAMKTSKVPSAVCGQHPKPCPHHPWKNLYPWNRFWCPKRVIDIHHKNGM